MKINLTSLKRRSLCLAGGTVALMVIPLMCVAQSNPLPKTIKIVVPFSAGAANDSFARTLGKRIATKFGVTVVIENKPGAGGSIGAEAVARAPADGATLLLSSVTFVTNAAVQKKLPFDPIQAFTPVAMVAKGPMLVVVNGKSRFRSMEDLLRESKGLDTGVSYGSAGPGSIAHLSSELLNAMAKTSARHIPYKGVANAVTDLMGGQIDFVVTTVASAKAGIDAGSLRALGVSTLTKSKLTGDIPPVAVAVPGYTVEAWWGVFAPAGTPDAIVQALNAEIRAAGLDPEIRDLYTREGAEAGVMSSQEFAQFVRNEIVRWRKLAEARKIELD